jgi:hypothetical protein
MCARRKFAYFFTLVLCLALAGCDSVSGLRGGGMPGNGTGYGGRQVYQWNYPGYVCTPPGSRTPIASYRDRITVYEDAAGRPVKAISSGDLCTDRAVEIPVTRIEPSKTADFIGFDKGTYQLTETAGSPAVPNGLVAEAWCQPLLTKPDEARELFIASADGSGNHPATLFVGGAAQNLAFSRSDATTQRTYSTGMGASLVIQLQALSAADPGQFSAQLTGILPDAGPGPVDAICRITPIPAPLLSVTVPPPPGTFFVSPGGSDSAACTRDAPCREIRRALSLVSAGGTIVATDGQYLGFDVVNLAANAAAPVAIRAFGSATQVTPTVDRADNRDTIFITGSSYVELDGLQCSGANRAGVRIDRSQHVTVRNGTFAGNGGFGIFADFSDDLLVENNLAYGAVSNDGISINDSSQRPIVRGNILHDNGRHGLQMDADAAIGGSGITQGAVVEGNVIYANALNGIMMDGVQSSILRNNLLYGNQGFGITAYRINGAAGPVGLQIENNTISQPIGAFAGVHLAQSAGVNLLRNNILVHADATKAGLELANASDVSNLDSDFNILSQVTASGTTVSLAAWKSAHPTLEVSSFSAAIGSLFVNPGAGDYHLSPTSPAIDAGQGGQDIGAFNAP